MGDSIQSNTNSPITSGTYRRDKTSRPFHAWLPFQSAKHLINSPHTLEDLLKISTYGIQISNGLSIIGGIAPQNYPTPIKQRKLNLLINASTPEKWIAKKKSEKTSTHSYHVARLYRIINSNALRSFCISISTFTMHDSDFVTIRSSTKSAC